MAARPGRPNLYQANKTNNVYGRMVFPCWRLVSDNDRAVSAAIIPAYIIPALAAGVPG